MIAIILWALLIIIIAIYANPGFLTFLFCVALPLGIVVYLLAVWINDKIS